MSETANDFLQSLTKHINEFFRYLYPGFLIISILYFYGPPDVHKYIAGANAILLSFLVIASGVAAYQVHRVVLEIATTVCVCIVLFCTFACSSYTNWGWGKGTTRYSLYDFFDSNFQGREIIEEAPWSVFKMALFKYFCYRQAYFYIRGQWLYLESHKNHWWFVHSRIHALYLTGEIALAAFFINCYPTSLKHLWISAGSLLVFLAFMEDWGLHRTECRIAENSTGEIIKLLEDGGFLKRSGALP